MKMNFWNEMEMNKMGLLKEIFSNMDEPALIIEFSKSDDKEKIGLKEETIGLKEENRRLRMMIKRMLEQGIREEKKIKKFIDVDHELLE